jgi:hypothetical protein
MFDLASLMEADARRYSLEFTVEGFKRRLIGEVQSSHLYRRLEEAIPPPFVDVGVNLRLSPCWH